MSIKSKQAPDWVLETEHAAWQPRDSTGRTVYDNHMWILGGWYTPQDPNPRDVWKSPDGIHWTRTVEVAPWVQSDLPVCLTFKNKLWFMGGRKLPGTEVSNKVWSSTDGANWTLEGEAGWSPRLGANYCVYNDRMWVMGGTSDFYNHNDETLFNDVWSSADGKNWTLECEHAPWSKRCHGAAVVFNDKIHVVAGGYWKPEMHGHNDVWSTTDGKNWQCVTDNAPWEGRIWFGLVNYKNHMWIFAGWNKDHGNFGDVWYSPDGKDWTQAQSNKIWKTRHEPAFYVFNDKIYLAGGHAMPLDNQVWSLQVDDDWFNQ